MDDTPRRKSIRLPADQYLGLNRYSITICTCDRARYFTERLTVDECVKAIGIATGKMFDVVVYCFMPDHLHLLLEAKQETSNLIHCIKTIKQRAGFVFKQRTGRSLWQHRYHDRILRREEDTLSIAWYIINNPVRAEIVSDPYAYPFTGSFLYNDLSVFHA